MFFVLSRAWTKEKTLSPHEANEPKTLYVLQHRSAESEGLRFDPHGDSEYFLRTTLVTRRKTSLSVNVYLRISYNMSCHSWISLFGTVSLIFGKLLAKAVGCLWAVWLISSCQTPWTPSASKATGSSLSDFQRTVLARCLSKSSNERGHYSDIFS